MDEKYSKFKKVLDILASIYHGETSRRRIAMKLGLPDDELDKTMADLFELQLIKKRDQFYGLTNQGRNIVEYIERSSDDLGNTPLILVEP
jgi:predicted transcriptional regulator